MPMVTVETYLGTELFYSPSSGYSVRVLVLDVEILGRDELRLLLLDLDRGTQFWTPRIRERDVK